MTTATPGARGTAALRGKRVLILSGPTREYLDPVRYLSNASSGRMGRALAEAAAAAGAEVAFVTGPVDDTQVPSGPAIRVQRVVSAAQMLDAGLAAFRSADVVLFVAAVADYRPVRASPRKKPKSLGLSCLALRPTPDIAATLGARKRPGQVLVGFALESADGLARARRKLARKKLDAIVLNGPSSMGADAASFQFVTSAPASRAEDWGRISKTSCARRILARAAARMGS